MSQLLRSYLFTIHISHVILAMKPQQGLAGVYLFDPLMIQGVFAVSPQLMVPLQLTYDALMLIRCYHMVDIQLVVLLTLLMLLYILMMLMMMMVVAAFVKHDAL